MAVKPTFRQLDLSDITAGVAMTYGVLFRQLNRADPGRHARDGRNPGKVDEQRAVLRRFTGDPRGAVLLC